MSVWWPGLGPWAQFITAQEMTLNHLSVGPPPAGKAIGVRCIASQEAGDGRQLGPGGSSWFKGCGVCAICYNNN